MVRFVGKTFFILMNFSFCKSSKQQSVSSVRAHMYEEGRAEGKKGKQEEKFDSYFSFPHVQIYAG
jgi:hypothetical protein